MIFFHRRTKPKNGVRVSEFSCIGTTMRDGNLDVPSTQSPSSQKVKLEQTSTTANKIIIENGYFGRNKYNTRLWR